MLKATTSTAKKCALIKGILSGGLICLNLSSSHGAELTFSGPHVHKNLCKPFRIEQLICTNPGRRVALPFYDKALRA